MLPAIDVQPVTAAVNNAADPRAVGVAGAEAGFAALVAELLEAWVPAETASAVGKAPPAAGNEEAQALPVAGNPLPPVLPPALPVAVAVPATETPSMSLSADRPAPAASIVPAAPSPLRPQQTDAGAQALPAASTAGTPALATREALTVLDTALPATEAPLAVAGESFGTVADKLTPSAHTVAQPAQPEIVTVAPAASAPTHAAAGPSPSAGRVLDIPVPVQQNGWGEALGNRVAWLANQQIQSAELHLNPPQLGPIDVQIRLADSQASIEFGAHHALVRDAIESALPKLREMFAAQGLHLADVNVSHQSFAQGRQPPAAGEGAGRSEPGQAAHAEVPLPAARALGIVDLYA
jgi:flagellar hook-length control protein FliK